MEVDKVLKNFLDEEGKLAQWPAKRAKQIKVLQYLAGKFETDTEYNEKEVNQILTEWHSFEDFFLLRRELVESGYLGRTPNGSKYWKVELDEDN